ncbi:Clp protease ClpP [Paraburkholderia sp. SARCC-3016]|uniref:head maturation protease, ClpP-related n=1 Tax=Paraburkholderia sp. SARCC-3016 TaxID=3058611 RepID=UPI002807A539|nr:head maturation protease, ClpP-related [Paraburkholderia sp. SARCC-3016]MDQ7981357.1 Clp protease ClpP [Paraburkholderia sp. SARCC-3016]
MRIYDEIGFWGVTAKDFIGELDAAASNGAQVVVAINSPGGDVLDAFAIYNALKRYAGRVTTRIDGIAASSASLVAMAGDTIVMPSNAMMMIHNPWTFAIGDADALRSTAETIEKMQASFIAAYASHTDLSDDEIAKMMDEETWLSATEAKALGLCDEIEDPVKLQASINVGAALARFRDVPQGLIDQIEEIDPAHAPASTPQPEPSPRAVAPTPTPAHTPPPVAGSTLAAHVFTACREGGIAELAEPIIVSCGLRDQTSVDARISEAREISGLCVAAKLPDVAPEFVASGLNVEQARARLFERVTAANATHIDSTQRPQGDQSRTAGGLSAAQIYATRRTAVQAKRS